MLKDNWGHLCKSQQPSTKNSTSFSQMKFLGLELGSWKYLKFREVSGKYQDYFLSPGGVRYTLNQMISMGCRYVDAAQKRSLTTSQLKNVEEMTQMKVNKETGEQSTSGQGLPRESAAF